VLLISLLLNSIYWGVKGMDLDNIAEEFKFSRLVTYLIGNPEADIAEQLVFERMSDELFPEIDVFTKQDVVRTFGIDQEDLDDLGLESVDGTSDGDEGVLYSRENVLERYNAVASIVRNSIQKDGLDDVKKEAEQNLDKLVLYFAKNTLIPFARHTSNTKLNLNNNYVHDGGYVSKFITAGDLRQAINDGELTCVKGEVKSGKLTVKVDKINGYDLAAFVLSKDLESPTKESVENLFGVTRLNRLTIESYGLGPGVRGSYSHVRSIYETVAERAKKFVLNGPWNKVLAHPVEIKGTAIYAGTFYFTEEAINNYCKGRCGENINKREFYEDYLSNLINQAGRVDRVAHVRKKSRTTYSSFNYKFITEGNAIVAINDAQRGEGLRNEFAGRGDAGLTGL
jgi:hypothetical protein